MKKNLSRPKRLTSLLVKPAGPDCNLACSYCFYRDKSAVFPETLVHRMSGEVLEATMRQLFDQSGPSVSVGWQGGEPTLMGLPFFEKAVELQIRFGRGKSVGNGLQTNGLLLDRTWAKFLREYHVLVGLSLDGPEHVHDRYRLKSGGQSTWREVVDRAGMLLDEGVETNALVVVNDYSVRFPEEVYEFHKSLGLVHMQFIPCVEADPADPSRGASFSAPGEAFGDFLVKLFDLWRADFRDGEPTTFVRFFDSLFFLYVDREPPECTLLPECGTYLVVEHNGDVYACDFFVEPAWKLGHVLDGKLIHMLNSARQAEFGRGKSRLPGPCRACPWLRICRGGCPKDRLRDPGDGGLSHFCAGLKKFFAHADPHFRALAAAWKEAPGGRC
ncbi:MAG: anaerobic sulfatase maturase [Candidatus Aminicenantes bacterium]|nr:anaerobic sulfatase maturase [Candidatus Aminicenantes bacterium]